MKDKIDKILGCYITGGHIKQTSQQNKFSEWVTYFSDYKAQYQ